VAKSIAEGDFNPWQSVLSVSSSSRSEDHYLKFKSFNMELLLTREYNENGVSGTLTHRSKRICDCIEPPWRDNQRQISCIPEGRYQLTPRLSLRFGWHLLVNNVPGRSYILIHAFNHALRESRGCIGPVKKLTGPGQGLSSRDALYDLMQLVLPQIKSGKQVFLTIKSANHEPDRKGR